MTALQQVQLEPFTEPDLLELEGIAYGAHVLRAFELRNNARRYCWSAERLHDAEQLLWRRITDLCEASCSEVWA